MAEVAELFERIVRRDEQALEILYDRFSGALYSAIIRIVRRREDAEEILCEVFHQAWDKAAVYDHRRGAVYTWLLRMARNRAIDKLRSRDHKNHRLEENDPGDPETLPGADAGNALDTLVLSEHAHAVREAMAGLSPGQRSALEAAYFEGYTQSEIAERAGLPLGTVKTRMRDGMRALRSLLEGRVEWP